jgi:heme/copper-type cytochrome/quinol oxidase subunit 2
MSDETELAEDSPNEEDMPEKTKEDGMASKIGFIFSLIITSILLIASLVLVLFWIFMYRGSYAWQENPRIEFNWHPTLMIGGFIFCSGFCNFEIFNIHAVGFILIFYMYLL